MDEPQYGVQSEFKGTVVNMEILVVYIQDDRTCAGVKSRTINMELLIRSMYATTQSHNLLLLCAPSWLASDIRI